MVADVPDLEDLLRYASASTAAGERRTEVKCEDLLVAEHFGGYARPSKRARRLARAGLTPYPTG
jgi:hypothetical protein